MSYSQEQKERFISMRASGMSFDKISAILDISKPTLIKWWFAFKKKIAMLEYANARELMDNYCLGRKAQLEESVSILARISATIKSTDLSKVNFATLLEMKRIHEEKVAARITELEIYADITAIGIDKDVFLQCKDDAAARAEGLIENLLDNFREKMRDINKKFRTMPHESMNQTPLALPRPLNGEEESTSRKTA